MSERDPVESVRRLPSREGQRPDPDREAAAGEPATEPAPPEARPEAPPKPGRQTPQRAVRARRPDRRGAVDEARDVSFPIVFRGYERGAVDAYVARMSQLVAELEATQLRDSVVQQALDEVGEQTSGILQHAHETAEEISSSSRAQAEGRIQRAQREAGEIRAEAEQFAQEVAADTRRLAQERMRMIEEIRRFADEVLGVADDAVDRLPPPEAGKAEDADGADDVDDTTRELRPPGTAESET